MPRSIADIIQEARIAKANNSFARPISQAVLAADTTTGQSSGNAIGYGLLKGLIGGGLTAYDRGVQADNDAAIGQVLKEYARTGELVKPEGMSADIFAPLANDLLVFDVEQNKALRQKMAENALEIQLAGGKKSAELQAAMDVFKPKATITSQPVDAAAAMTPPAEQTQPTTTTSKATTTAPPADSLEALTSDPLALYSENPYAEANKQKISMLTDDKKRAQSLGDSLRSEISNAPIVRQAIDSRYQLNALVDAYKSNDKAADMLFYTIIPKLLDPGSVTREAEAEGVRNTATQLDKIMKIAESELTNTGQLRPETKLNLLRQGTNLVNARAEAAQNQYIAPRLSLAESQKVDKQLLAIPTDLNSQPFIEIAKTLGPEAIAAAMTGRARELQQLGKSKEETKAILAEEFS